MELTYEKTTHIGLGYATQADAFQCGREAAQMAKGQVPVRSNDMVFVFGPNGIHFKDFVEGVRLVTGEDRLVGIPVDWVISNDLPSLDACLVLVLQLSSLQFTIVSSGEQSASLDSEITSLITQCRDNRGNAGKTYDYHGLLVFENRPSNEKSLLARRLAADMGLETWLIGASPGDNGENALVCRNQMIRNGFVGIECFSHIPCGISSVATGSFTNQPDIYKEAIKSSMRDALAQLQNQKPALGLLFLDLPPGKMSRDDLWGLFQASSGVTHNMPLIAIPTRHQFSRCSNRSTTVQEGSVVTWLVPH